MKKVCITRLLKILAKEYTKEIYPLALKGLGDLKTKLSKKPRKNAAYIQYIELIETKCFDIIKFTPSERELFINNNRAILTGLNLSVKLINTKECFYESISKALGYANVRESISIPYILKSGLKTCVYCNAQLTIVVNKIYYNKKRVKLKKKSARLQLDHFYPQSKYPFLAVSFFNLYPTCANCNLIKSKTSSLFELYTENYHENLNPFKFHLSPYSILQYRMNYNNKRIQIRFDGVDKSETAQFNEMFCIEEIYKTQKDVAEELIIRSDIYSCTKKFIKKFISIFNTKKRLY